MEPTKIENDILAAATELFFERGFAATSTTDIARRVGCNQALVHYYYRTKENLFQQIFVREINQALTLISAVLDQPENAEFDRLVDTIIEAYFCALKKNPRLPFFLVNELILNQDRRIFIRENFIKNPLRAEAYYKYTRLVEQLIAEGKIRQVEPFDLLVDVVSLVGSTFLSLPLFADLLSKSDEEKEAYVEQRKNEIKTLLINGLKP